jgi:hypothetical protein
MVATLPRAMYENFTALGVFGILPHALVGIRTHGSQITVTPVTKINYALHLSGGHFFMYPPQIDPRIDLWDVIFFGLTLGVIVAVLLMIVA